MSEGLIVILTIVGIVSLYIIVQILYSVHQYKKSKKKKTSRLVPPIVDPKVLEFEKELRRLKNMD